MARPAERATFTCPVCGEPVFADVPGCRECGSTAETGWSADTEYDGLDLPEPDDDTPELDAPSPRPRWMLIIAAAAVAATLLVSMW